MSRAPTVREATEDDLDDVRHVIADAYGGEKMPEMFDALRDSVAWLDLTFVAEEKGKVVAAVCYTRGWVDAPTKLVEVLVLTPLAVRLDRQRNGTGSLLVKESLELLHDRGEPLVFLEGDPGFFCRMGFVAGGELGFTPPSPRIPDAVFQVGTLAGYEQAWMSGPLVYPDVWWRQDAVGLRPEA